MRLRAAKRTTAALVALGCLAVSPLSAGVVFEVEVTDHAQSPPKTETVETSAEGRNLRMGIAAKRSNAPGEVIFRGDRREMVVVDHAGQSYMVMDEEAIEQLAGQLNAVAAQMQAALKNVPEERRAMVEQMLKQRMPAGTETPKRSVSMLERTDDEAEMNGYPCVKYEVSRDGRKLRELWVTDWDNVEGGDEVAKIFEEMADFFRQVMDAVPNMGQGGASLDDSFLDHMKELDGFPVVTREFDDDGSLEAEATLRSARRQTLDPEAFEPPSGYKRQTMMPGQ